MMSFDAREYLGKFPPPDYSLHWYARFFSDACYLHGLKTSVIIAVVATVVSTTTGVSAAIVLDRYEFPGKAGLEALFLSPLVVPAAVIGFALLLFFKGQILSLLGPSGCGKTTTVRMVSGFEEPNEGSIFIAGQDMKGKRPYERNVRDVAHLGAAIHLVIELAGGRRITATEQYLGQPLELAGKRIDLTFRPEDCIIVPADS